MKLIPERVGAYYAQATATSLAAGKAVRVRTHRIRPAVPCRAQRRPNGYLEGESSRPISLCKDQSSAVGSVIGSTFGGSTDQSHRCAHTGALDVRNNTVLFRTPHNWTIGLGVNVFDFYLYADAIRIDVANNSSRGQQRSTSFQMRRRSSI
ncbi:MAG: hypothetical protein IPF83_13865 [Rhodanobacteraceae bacterium]|nr:hypothetical protein [Rhodanobacteraceae bacterium]MBP9155486.1 hypothetical protein [Xanthomonadales bacterium]